MLRKLLILLLVLMATGCATHAVTSGRVVVRDDGAPAGLRFQERDRAMVVEYFRASKRNKALPTPVKREQLPPGLAKRDTLPRSLHGQLLPADLEVVCRRCPARTCVSSSGATWCSCTETPD